MRPAGKKRFRLDIQKPPTERDAFGRPTGDWTTVAGSIPAAIRTLSGNEVEVARQLVAKATHMVNIGFLHKLTVTTKHRFKFGDRIFNIGHVDDVDELKLELDCLVSEDLE